MAFAGSWKGVWLWNHKIDRNVATPRRFSDQEEHKAREKKVMHSLAFLQATGKKHLSEGRLGEAIRYIQEFRMLARLTKRELALITSQELLDRCRRSISGVKTVEEDAGTSWNLALTFFANQLYREAEVHVIYAARLYNELGFESHALDCDQFLDAIQDAMGTLLRYPEAAASYHKNLPKLLLTHPERFRDLFTSAKNPIYERQKKIAEILWLVAFGDTVPNTHKVPPGEGDRVKIQNPSERWTRDDEVEDSFSPLKAASERHLSEGRLGNAIQYIQEFGRVARLAERWWYETSPKELLDRCRRDTSGIEEEAGLSWNLALTSFAGQRYQEAERQVIDAARLYKELGFKVQATESSQLRQGLTQTSPDESGRFRDLVPSANDPIYESEKEHVEMVWLVAGALQCAPDSLVAGRIVSIIKRYHPEKIRRYEDVNPERSRDWNAIASIRYILCEEKAFEEHETLRGHWRLCELGYLPPFPSKKLSRGYSLDLPSSGDTVPNTRKVPPGEGDRVKIQIPSEHRTRDDEVVNSLVFLQAVSERHLSEGRLGEAIQYIQEFGRVARLTKRELDATAPQELLDRCRRDTSGIEEEAGLSWNLALTSFAGQRYQEAERQVIDAARLYKELGFKVQAAECDQFLHTIQRRNGDPPAISNRSSQLR
ncbi:hypothetical protein FRC04_007977 [Tulasnella sp. 424]|nr:hypothetical protein FRC04_007977 [Tulasnella sp. 424]